MRKAALKNYFAAAVLCLAALCAAAPAYAVRPDEILPNPQLEARARALSEQLRCLVCRNENIDESNAPLARDLRLLVRERLKAGDTDAQLLDFMVARYGQYVLLKPPFFSPAMFLWLFPLTMLALTIAALFYLRAKAEKRRAADPLPELSAEEEAELVALLDEGKSLPEAEAIEAKKRAAKDKKQARGKG